MRISFEKLNFNIDDHLDAMVRWDKDQETLPFRYPRKSKDPLVLETKEQMKQKFKQNPEYASGIYLIFDGTRPIGDVCLQLDPPHLMKKTEKTSWIGITIGEKEYWGTGVAQKGHAIYCKGIKNIRRKKNRAWNF